MNYTPEIDEDDGFCPRCGSSDTISLGTKLKRVCLSCEFSEEFESRAQVKVAWQVKIKAPRVGTAARVEKAVKVPEPVVVPKVEGVPKEVEKVIEVVEPGVTRVTVPTHYREEFGRFLESRKVGQASPCKTDVWNNIESAYTVFELLTPRAIADALFDEWAAGSV